MPMETNTALGAIYARDEVNNSADGPIVSYMAWNLGVGGFCASCWGTGFTV